MIRYLYVVIILLGGCASLVLPELRTNGQDVDPDEVWEIVSDFEDCADRRVPSDLKIEIVRTWHVSECSGAQVFECPAFPPPKPGEKCPLLCAGMTWVGRRHVLVTPNLAALPHELVHSLGILDHDHELFARCGGPYRAP